MKVVKKAEKEKSMLKESIAFSKDSCCPQRS
jgi:hypothetical protein